LLTSNVWVRIKFVTEGIR